MAVMYTKNITEYIFRRIQSEIVYVKLKNQLPASFEVLFSWARRAL